MYGGEGWRLSGGRVQGPQKQSEHLAPGLQRLVVGVKYRPDPPLRLECPAPAATVDSVEDGCPLEGSPARQRALTLFARKVLPS